MDRQKLGEIISYIVNQGLATIKANTDSKDVAIDYVAIFAKDENEYQNLLSFTQTLGKEVDKNTINTGHTFSLNEPLETPAGHLKFIKIRKPDPTRPQRGAPDFKVQNYQAFKDKYLRRSGNFTLMLRKDYEMIELKDVDVLVYIPNKPLTKRL